jgi:hypothetical protein
LRRGCASGWRCSAGSAGRQPRTPDASIRTSCSTSTDETFVNRRPPPSHPPRAGTTVTREEPPESSGGRTRAYGCGSQSNVAYPVRSCQGSPRNDVWTARRARRDTAPCGNAAAGPVRPDDRSTPTARTRRGSFRLSNGAVVRTDFVMPSLLILRNHFNTPEKP